MRVTVRARACVTVTMRVLIRPPLPASDNKRQTTSSEHMLRVVELSLAASLLL